MRNSLRSKSFGKPTGITVKALTDLFEDIDKLHSLSEFKNWYKRAKIILKNIYGDDERSWVNQFQEMQLAICENKLDYAKAQAKMILNILIDKRQYLRIFNLPMKLIFTLNQNFHTSGEEIIINKKVLLNMIDRLTAYNDFREKWRREHLRRKLSLNQELTWGNKCVQIFWSFWNKYQMYFNKLVSSSMSRNALIFNCEPIQSIRPFKYRSRKTGADGEPIEKILDGWDLWISFVKEVTRLYMFSKKYEYGEKIGTKETRDKMWREIAEEYKKLGRKKYKADKCFDILKSKYDEKYKSLLPGKRSPVPAESQFWEKLYELTSKTKIK